ncbi:MAG: transpeptidase family protein, partial [Acidobacteriota bacterium]|nr:transpeptidase family protein [Acidobacteriota bacterium]
IGTVDFEENGNSGIEQSLNEELEGHAGALHMLVDVKQRGREGRLDNAASPGRPVQLTIHGRLQYIAETELKKAVLAHQCKSGSIVAMNPKNGEILAMANYPAFDPNQPVKPGQNVAGRSNLAVTTPFEPGSVFKVITIAAALETTNIRPQTVVSCGNGHLTLFGRTIHDHNSYASLPVEDVLARSSNIGAINIGLRVGDRNMFDYLHRFGFGLRTGLTLPGESGGQVRPLKRWQKSSIGSVAMGHEVSVTALQLARACSAIANGGYLVKPKLVLDGARLLTAAASTTANSDAPVRIIRPETANTMRQMMRGVVDKPYGTGYKYAHIPGYSSGGKTGTAQMIDPKTHTYTHLYNASFMGFAPVNDPAVVVVVTVNGSSGLAGYGGPASAPAFREVAAAALRLLNVPKDLPDSPLPDPRESEADDNDVALAELASSDPQPLAGENDTALSGQRPFFTGPEVPDFRGMTMKDVIQKCAEAGLRVEFTGARTGLVRSQSPVPGVMLPNETTIRVQMGR